MLRSPVLPRARRHPGAQWLPPSQRSRNRRAEKPAATKPAAMKPAATKLPRNRLPRSRVSAKGPSEAGRPAERRPRRQAGSLPRPRLARRHHRSQRPRGEAGCRSPSRQRLTAKPSRSAEAEGRGCQANTFEPEGRCHARNERAEGNRQTGTSEANSARSAALVRARATSVGRLPPRPRGPAGRRRPPRARCSMPACPVSQAATSASTSSSSSPAS